MELSAAGRLSGAAMLLAGAAYAAPAFIPATLGTSRSPALLRGASAASEAGESKSRLGSVMPLGLVASAFAIGAAGRQRRQPTSSARRFFGGDAPAPQPTKKATSYKDFQDPWLGAADLGFDPLSLAVQGGTFDKAASAVPETTYYNYRESEVKHGRFAMVAFLSIFAESADRSALLHQLGQVSIEDKLDGTLGLDEVQAPVLLVGIGYQALAEYNLQRAETDGNFLSVEYKKNRIPGDLGFDPLALGTGAKSDTKGLHNIEVNTGRLAMIGVTTFLVKEFLVKDENLVQKILSDSAI